MKVIAYQKRETKDAEKILMKTKEILEERKKFPDRYPKMISPLYLIARRGLFPHVFDQLLGEHSLVGGVPGFDVAFMAHEKCAVMRGEFAVTLSQEHLRVEVSSENVGPPLETRPDGLPDFPGDIRRYYEAGAPILLALLKSH